MAYLFGMPIVVSIEWYFQYIFENSTIPQKGVTRFLITIAFLSLAIFLSAYAILASRWDSYYVIVSLLLTLANLTLWIFLVYGKTLLSKWTKLDGPNSITIKSDRTIYKVEFDQLSHFSSINKVVVAHLKSGKQIITGFNLSELEKLLPNRFFRINRKFILNREVILGVKSVDNQKLEVKLREQSFANTLVVSRYRASEFKKWLI
ncbi:MAG: LytTR family DNA-binding domain-containing protein [Cyclobacteriaceae bacterium]